MTFKQLIRRVIRNRVAVLAPDGPFGPCLWRLEQGTHVPEAVQFDLWRDPGRFFVIGGSVQVLEGWRITQNPATPAAAAIAQAYGATVTAVYHRQDNRPNPIICISRPPPSDPTEFG